MKYMRLITLVLTLAVVFMSTAYAAIDWTAMESEEIEAEINNGLAELIMRGYSSQADWGKDFEDEPEPELTPTPAPEAANANRKEGKAKIMEVDGVKVTATAFEVTENDWFDKTLKVYYTVENNSDNDFEAYFDITSINDWEVDSVGTIEVGAGHKANDAVKLDLGGANISLLAEVEKVTFTMSYKKPGTDDYEKLKPKNIWLKKKK